MRPEGGYTTGQTLLAVAGIVLVILLLVWLL